MQTQNLAIMFTDIKGYTERTSSQSHSETSSLLKRHQNLVLPIVEAFEGRVVKAIGDAFLVVFRSPTRAVLCGMTIQDRLHQFNHGREDKQQIHLRVAVNVGEVLVSRGDVFGEAVNIAARIEAITPAGEVYLSEAVYLTMNKSEATCERVGSFELKGIPEPVAVYRVPPARSAPVVDPSAAPTETSAPALLMLPHGGKHLAQIDEQTLTPSRKRLLAGTGLVLLLCAGAAATVPGYLRARQWEQIESLIGRGDTDDAMVRLGGIRPTGEVERARVFDLQAQMVGRLMERGEPRRAAELLLRMLPDNEQEKALRFKTHQQVLDALLKDGDLEGSTRVLNHVGATGPVENKVVFEERARLARALLEKGRLDELRRQVQMLLAQDDRNPVGHVLAGHLEFALSTREDPAARIAAGLDAYGRALAIELALGKDPRLVQNVVASYSNKVAAPRRQHELMLKADSLVKKYIRHEATDALIRQLEDPDTGKDARDRLSLRIKELGAEREVDRVKLMVQELASARCVDKGSSEVTRRLIGQLREDGAGDPRALGALLRFAQQHNDCEEDARDAIFRLLGEHVGFVSQDDVNASAALLRLQKLSCARAPRDVDTALAELARHGSPRTVGPLLRVALAQPACTDAVLRTVETLLERRVVFETPQETRTRELVAALSTPCKGRDAPAVRKTIGALALSGDGTAVGPLLAVAAQHNACHDDALAAARRLTGQDELSLRGISANHARLRAARCRTRKVLPAFRDIVDALVADADLRAVGDLLAVAQDKGPCADAALAGARQLLKSDGLTLEPPAEPVAQAGR